MKALRVAIITLVLLMAAGLANSVYLTARCDDWTARLNAVTSAAESPSSPAFSVTAPASGCSLFFSRE